MIIIHHCKLTINPLQSVNLDKCLWYYRFQIKQQAISSICGSKLKLGTRTRSKLQATAKAKNRSIIPDVKLSNETTGEFLEYEPTVCKKHINE